MTTGPKLTDADVDAMIDGNGRCDVCSHREPQCKCLLDWDADVIDELVGLVLTLRAKVGEWQHVMMEEGASKVRQYMERTIEHVAAELALYMMGQREPLPPGAAVNSRLGHIVRSGAGGGWRKWDPKVLGKPVLDEAAPFDREKFDKLLDESFKKTGDSIDSLIMSRFAKLNDPNAINKIITGSVT